MNRNPRIRETFSRIEMTAKKEAEKRLSEYHRNPEAYEAERLARLAAYAAKNGSLPAPKKIEKKEEPSIPAMGFETAVKLTETPTRTEKPLRRTVMWYKPQTV